MLDNVSCVVEKKEGEKEMKKALGIFMLTVLALVLAGCKEEQKESVLSVVTDLEYSDYAREAADYFMQRHSGTKIQIQVLPDAKERRETEIQKLRTETMSGNGADIYLLRGLDMNMAEQPECLFENIGKTMESGVFAKLDSYMDADGYWESGSYKKEFLTAGQYQGHQYVLPLSCNYYVYESPAEDVVFEGEGLDEWLEQIGSSGNPAFQNQMSSQIIGLMNGSLNQPAIDMEERAVVFEKDKWIATEKKLFEIYKNALESEEVQETDCLFTRVDNISDYSEESAGNPILQAIPDINGRKMATVGAFGAVGMSCKEKETAYEYLMLFLNDEMKKEKGDKMAALDGFLGVSMAPVQERAWDAWFARYGIRNQALQEQVRKSFGELDGAFFVTQADYTINASVRGLSHNAGEYSHQEIEGELIQIAEQAERQYEMIVKE